MADGPAPVLSAAEAKKRFILYFLLKLVGLAILVGGVVLLRGGTTAAGAILLAIGAGALFVRPRHLGLTTRPER
ncbi:hypothetical protein [Sandarakinorhabdus sp. DWP1-3-1]|uniref:hypothetical protein n=1 Tax=Sandarakinorhabdus sp. DWP1-3-1 TaxID=2804627 RepID=UPI003CEF94E9